MQKHQERLRPKPNHKTRKARPIYILKKSTTGSEGSVVGSETKESLEENFDLDKQLSSIMESYGKLQIEYEEVNEQFKSAVFFKSKIEREKVQSEKIFKEKEDLYEKVLANLKEKKEAAEELSKKISECEKENKQIEKENADLLQVILEKDKEIQRMQDSHVIYKTSNKGVNTVNGGFSDNLDAGDQKMQEIYDEYEAQVKDAEHKLKTVEDSLEVAKARELELLGKKAEIERDLNEFKDLLKLCNEPKNKSEQDITDIRQALTNLKKTKDSIEINLKESKTNTYIYKILTMFFV